MNRDKKNIDKLFEQGLKGYKETPPVYAWDKLDAELGRAGRRKALYYIRMIAASIIILLAFGAGYFYAIYNINSGSSGQVSETGNTVEPAVIPASTNITDVKDNDVNQNAVSVQRQDNILNNKTKGFAKVKSPATELPIFATASDDNLPAKNHSAGDVRIHRIDFKDIKSISVNNTSLQNLTVDKKSEPDSRFIIESEPARDYGFNYPDDKPDILRWTVGAQVAPIKSYRDISTTYSGGSFVDEGSFNNSEEPVTSLAAGVDINYNVSKRVGFQTGMYYSRIGQVNNDALSYVEENGKFLLYSIETSLGVIRYVRENIPSNIREVADAKDTVDLIDRLNVKVIQDFDIFEVPLLLRYKILDKRFSVNITGGISPAFITKSNAFLEVDSQKYDIENADNINSVYFNSAFTLGLEYSVIKKLSFSFEPTFKYALSPINKDGKFDYHPYSISWFTGIKYRF